jgi:hypothetical protein
MLVDLPIGTVIPGDVMCADRMTDEEILHLAAAVDEHRRRIVVEELRRLGGFQVLHGRQFSMRDGRALGPLVGSL